MRTLSGMCKLGKFQIMEEKRINASLNVWIRGPGLTAVFAWAWAAYVANVHANPSTTSERLLAKH